MLKRVIAIGLLLGATAFIPADTTQAAIPTCVGDGRGGCRSIGCFEVDGLCVRRLDNTCFCRQGIGPLRAGEVPCQ